jgi:hypothetical protein
MTGGGGLPKERVEGKGRRGGEKGRGNGGGEGRKPTAAPLASGHHLGRISLDVKRRLVQTPPPVGMEVA